MPTCCTPGELHLILLTPHAMLQLHWEAFRHVLQELMSVPQHPQRTL